MPAIIHNWPWLLTMAVLVCCSSFFSASEAALFCLRWPDRRELAAGNRSAQSAVRLLHDPDRLLSAVLFWNLLVNVIYYASTSIISFRVSRDSAGSDAWAVGFSLGAVLTLIFFSEMLPKSVAVLQPKSLAARVGLPLSLAVRLVDPLMPALRTINLLSRRLLWPGLKQEASMELADLNRAIEASTAEQELVEQERIVLSNIVALSALRADEWMRPRKQFRTFRPPVSASEVRASSLASRYVLISSPDGEDVVGAIPLAELRDLPADHLERHAMEVTIVPWCATVAAALEQLNRQQLEVAAVVNELGENIGIMTRQDIFDAIFSVSPARGERMLNRAPVVKVAENVWHVDGMTNLRRLSQQLDTALPESQHATIGGVVQEELERLPHAGDECDWGPLQLLVIAVGDELGLMLAVTKRPEEDPSV